jgi:hypothetical protein
MIVRKLQLVAATKQAPEPENTRLILGDFIADVLLDARHDARIFHWIVQKVGSAAIIHWGQEHTFQEATGAAQGYLESLMRASEQKKA